MPFVSVIFSMLEHSEKESILIFSEHGIVSSFNPVQPGNANKLILFTLSGIVMLVKLVQ